ncbi:MAG: hypothetical protein GF401_12025 [Chitinivibrionales bacterium]|nr:hypothetical protein [Chitinivibrionales bacterium]
MQINKKCSSGLIRFIKFGIVGGSGVIVNAGILRILTKWAEIDYKISAIIAIETAIISNFLLNYFWTWQDRRHSSQISFLSSFWKFNLSCGMVALAVNWGILVFFTEFINLYYEISNLIGIGCGTVANYLLSHYWAFAPQPVKKE